MWRRRKQPASSGVCTLDLAAGWASSSQVSRLEEMGLPGLGSAEIATICSGGITHLTQRERLSGPGANACGLALPDPSEVESVQLRSLSGVAMCGQCDRVLWRRARELRGRTPAIVGAFELVEAHLELEGPVALPAETGGWEAWEERALEQSLAELGVRLERAVRGPVRIEGSRYSVQGELEVAAWNVEADRLLGELGQAEVALARAETRVGQIASREQGMLWRVESGEWAQLEALARSSAAHRRAFRDEVMGQLRAPRTRSIALLEACERVLGAEACAPWRQSGEAPVGDVGAGLGVVCEEVLLLRQESEHEHALGASHEVARLGVMRVHRMPRYAAEVMLGVEGWRGQQIAPGALGGREVDEDEVTLALELWGPGQGWLGCVEAACRASR